MITTEKVQLVISSFALLIFAVLAVLFFLVFITLHERGQCDLLFKVETVSWSQNSDQNLAILSLVQMVETPGEESWEEGQLVQLNNDCHFTAVKK